jgi:hypothetical protein
MAAVNPDAANVQWGKGCPVFRQPVALFKQANLRFNVIKAEKTKRLLKHRQDNRPVRLTVKQRLDQPSVISKPQMRCGEAIHQFRKNCFNVTNLTGGHVFWQGYRYPI